MADVTSEDGILDLGDLGFHITCMREEQRFAEFGRRLLEQTLHSAVAQEGRAKFSIEVEINSQSPARPTPLGREVCYWMICSLEGGKPHRFEVCYRLPWGVD